MRRIEFYEKRKVFFSISVAAILLGILCCFIFGTQLDIQFKGGSILSYTYTGELEADGVRDLAVEKLGMSVSADKTTDASGATVIKISCPGNVSTEAKAAFDDALVETYPDNNIKFNETRSVSASMGTSFLVKSLVAIVLAATLMVLYIWWRFRKIGGLSAGTFALVALLMDVFLAFVAFVIFRIPLNDNFVAVILTIFGYSINDSIVIFDRIRENEELIGDKYPVEEIVTRSINQSFGRTINTSLCTLVVMAVLSVFALVTNLDSLISFAVPMMFGIISGFYSSTFITGPLWTVWKKRKEAKGAKNA